MQKEWQVIYKHIVKLQNPSAATTDVFSIFLSILLVAIGIFCLCTVFYLTQKLYHSISQARKPLLFLAAALLIVCTTSGFSYAFYFFWQHRNGTNQTNPLVLFGSFSSIKKFQMIEKANKEETTLQTDFEVYLKNITLYSLKSTGKLIQQKKLESFSFALQNKTFAQHLQKHLAPTEKIYFLFTASEKFMGYIQGKRVFLVK
ncbi:MAG: hypothetical protein AAF518_08900 [Spirochaetota bacterium]